MRTGKGFANGPTFSQFFHGDHTDYVHARSIGNGKSHQYEVGGIAQNSRTSCLHLAPRRKSSPKMKARAMILVVLGALILATSARAADQAPSLPFSPSAIATPIRQLSRIVVVTPEDSRSERTRNRR